MEWTKNVFAECVTNNLGWEHLSIYERYQEVEVIRLFMGDMTKITTKVWIIGASQWCACWHKYLTIVILTCRINVVHVKITEFVMYGLGSISGKGENACKPVFSVFPTMFSAVFFLRSGSYCECITCYRMVLLWSHNSRNTAFSKSFWNKEKMCTGYTYLVSSVPSFCTYIGTPFSVCLSICLCLSLSLSLSLSCRGKIIMGNKAMITNSFARFNPLPDDKF